MSARAPWTPVILALAAGLGVGGGGCAYFNGMYNAYHYQSLALASERAGRAAEARERWEEAAIHAESLATRHPDSRWMDAALLVRGRALVHLEYWADAVPVLQEASRHARSDEQRDEALALLGQAELGLGQPRQACAALDTAVASRSAEVRGEALLYRGRALLALGETDSALADLSASRLPLARFDLARAELAARDTAAAGALYDSLTGERPYRESEWRAGLDSLAAAGATTRAAGLVDALVRREDLSSGMRARLLIDDAGRRLGAGDSAAAAARFGEAESEARDSAEGRTATVALARLAIADADDDSVLAVENRRMARLQAEGGAAGMEAQALLRLLRLVDDDAAAPTAPDAHWFQRAELLRDSLKAVRLAAVDFAAMAARFPDSPWTPKGLMAAIWAGHPGADSLRTLLEQRYAHSPYTLAALGDTASAAAFERLEDSLRLTLAAGEPGPQVRPRAPVGDEPVIRRTPTRPASPAGPPRPED